VCSTRTAPSKSVEVSNTGVDRPARLRACKKLRVRSGVFGVFFLFSILAGRLKFVVGGARAICFLFRCSHDPAAFVEWHNNPTASSDGQLNAHEVEPYGCLCSGSTNATLSYAATAIFPLPPPLAHRCQQKFPCPSGCFALGGMCKVS
jgi:hypothetical protein